MAKSMTASRDLRAPKPPGTSLPKRNIKEPGQDRRQILKSRQKAFQQQHKEFFDTTSTIETKSVEGVSQLLSVAPSQTIKPQPSRLLQAMLRYVPARQGIVELFFPTCPTGDPVSLQGAVEALIALRDEASMEVIYPDIHPHENRICPYCSKTFSR